MPIVTSTRAVTVTARVLVDGALYVASTRITLRGDTAAARATTPPA